MARAWGTLLSEKELIEGDDSAQSNFRVSNMATYFCNPALESRLAKKQGLYHSGSSRYPSSSLSHREARIYLFGSVIMSHDDDDDGLFQRVNHLLLDSTPAQLDRDSMRSKIVTHAGLACRRNIAPDSVLHADPPMRTKSTPTNMSEANSGWEEWRAVGTTAAGVQLRVEGEGQVTRRTRQMPRRP